MITQTPIAYTIEEGGHLSLKIITLNSIEIAQQCIDNHDPFTWVGKDTTRGKGISVLRWHDLSVLLSTDLSKQCTPELKFSVLYFPHPETKETVIWDSIIGIFIVGSSPIKSDSIPRSLYDFVDLIERHDQAWGKIQNFQRQFLSDPNKN